LIVDYIDRHKRRFGVEPICAALQAEGIAVAPSGYYAAKKRLPSRRALSDAALAETIEATFWDREKGRGVYGARKMWHQLRRDGVTGPGGRPVARCTVERLMRELGLRGARRGQPTITTRADRHSERAPDLVDRDEPAVGGGPDLRADLVGDGVHRVRLRRVLATDRRVALRVQHAHRTPARRPRDGVVDP
jgi:putative transposase